MVDGNRGGTVDIEAEVFKGKSGWYLRLVERGNHETLLTSESYVSKWNAQRAARKLGLHPVLVEA